MGNHSSSLLVSVVVWLTTFTLVHTLTFRNLISLTLCQQTRLTGQVDEVNWALLPTRIVYERGRRLDYGKLEEMNDGFPLKPCWKSGLTS